MEDFGGGDGVIAHEVGEIAGEDGPVETDFRHAAVPAFDEGGIQGDDVHRPSDNACRLF